MDRNFGGIVWTDHALERLAERGIKQGDAWATWRNPDQSRKGKEGHWIYYKTYGNQKIEVVTGKNEQGQTIVVSVWSKPILKTSHNKYRLSSGWWDNFLEKILQKLFGHFRKKQDAKF